MRYFILIILIYFFNINLLSAELHKYSNFAYKLDSTQFCQNLSDKLSPLTSILKKNNITMPENLPNNIEWEPIEAPSWAVFDDDPDNAMVLNILNCLADKSIISEKCSKNTWSSKKNREKCLNKISTYYEKKAKKEKKKRLAIEEKCIKKAGDMKTESAFKMMYTNCMKQNNY
tara:strand:+ start:1541 stop:2059 length:519 start_codon:yes stop_codon:yes gene_type:complete